MKDFTNKSINANCLQGLQTLTGKMYFYEDGFSFKADSVNGVINKGKTLYKDIKTVNKRNTMGIIPNGLSIVLNNGEEIVFVVSSRNEVREYMISRLVKA